MKNLYFKSLKQFTEASQSDDCEIAASTLESISESYYKGENKSLLYNIFFEDQPNSFEVSLPRSEWVKSLDKCLKDFEKQQENDLAIDCYLLRKKLLEE